VKHVSEQRGRSRGTIKLWGVAGSYRAQRSPETTPGRKSSGLKNEGSRGGSCLGNLEDKKKKKEGCASGKKKDAGLPKPTGGWKNHKRTTA